jgi:hypothetical protein
MSNKQLTYSFAGVFIPANIWTNPQLSWLDKIVWAVVANLHDGSRICTATNTDLAEMIGENEMLVWGSVLKLIDLKLLNSRSSPDGSMELWPVTIEFVDRVIEPEAEAQASTADVQRVVDIYNDHCKSMPRAEKLTPSRVRRIRSLIRDRYEDESFKLLFLKAQNSDFLSGRSGKWTGCNIDWLLAPSNIERVLEGIYDNRSAASVKPFIAENLR